MRFFAAPLAWSGLVVVLAGTPPVAWHAQQPPPRYDLVIANGRVMDPESGLDAVRHVGIRAGKVEAISEAPLAGARVIDATSHVVAPGFVDLHEHGQQEESYRMMVRDGVTSAFELEVGTGDVARWYAAREGGQIVNCVPSATPESSTAPVRVARAVRFGLVTSSLLSIRREPDNRNRS